MVKGYETERDLKMNVGDTVAIGGYTFGFGGATATNGPNCRAARGIVDVSRGGENFTTLYPEKRTYNESGMAMTEAAIRNMPPGDLYVSLGEPIADGAW